MTVEQRDKYAYELMVKNNPEEAVKQLLLKDKIIEKTQQSYDEEYNLRHKLSLELSIEKDKVFELSNHLTSYSSEETMLKRIEELEKINKQFDIVRKNCIEALEEVKKLENENELLKACNYDYYQLWTKQVNKVGKAIKYIEEHKQISMFADLRKEGTHQYDLECDADELLKILKGEDDEENIL